MHYEISIRAQSGINPLSLAGCFDALFLKSLVCSRVPGKEVTDVTQLSDCLIRARIELLSSTTKNVSFEKAMTDVKRNI